MQSCGPPGIEFETNDLNQAEAKVSLCVLILTGLPHNQRWAGAFLGLHVSDSGGSGLQCSTIPPALHTGLRDSPAAVADLCAAAAADPDQTHLHPYESSSGWHPPLLQLRSGQKGHGLPAPGAFTRGNSAHCGELPTSAEGSVTPQWSWRVIDIDYCLLNCNMSLACIRWITSVY